MIGFLIITHEAIGTELKRAAELIAGKIENIETVEFYQSDSLEKLKKEIESKLDKVDDGDGVIIFTDLFGGSCTNVSYEIKEKRDKEVKIITGVSLNMLLDAVFEREKISSVTKLANIIYKNSRKATVVI